MYKKLICIAVIACLLMLAGCGGDGSGAQPSASPIPTTAPAPETSAPMESETPSAEATVMPELVPSDAPQGSAPGESAPAASDPASAAPEGSAGSAIQPKM